MALQKIDTLTLFFVVKDSGILNKMTFYTRKFKVLGKMQLPYCLEILRKMTFKAESLLFDNRPFKIILKGKFEINCLKFNCSQSLVN